MNFTLHEGPADGHVVEMEATHFGELYVPLFSRRDAAEAEHVRGPVSDSRWFAIYELSTDGSGRFLGWTQRGY